MTNTDKIWTTPYTGRAGYGECQVDGCKNEAYTRGSWTGKASCPKCKAQGK